MHNLIIKGFGKEAQLLEKKAFNPISMLVTQVGQNALIKKMLHSKSFNKELADTFLMGLKGQKPGVVARFVSGLRKGMISPEIASMVSAAGRQGARVRKALAKKGIERLGKEDIVLLRRILAGNLDKAMQSRKFRELALKNKNLSALTQAIPRVGANLPELARVSGGIKEIERVIMNAKKSPTTALALPFLRKGLKNVNALTPAKHTGLKRVLGNVSEGLGTTLGATATAVIDPATAGLNLAKTTYYSPGFRALSKRVTPLRKAHNWLDRKLLIEPVKRRAAMGAAGQKLTKTDKFKDLANTYLVNPVPPMMAESARHFAGTGISREASSQARRFFHG